MGALSHLRILDLTRVLAGPWCTQTLADLGADVIKLERPGRGDDTRGWGPPYAGTASGDYPGEAAYYLSINRNKRSIALDLTQAAAQRLIRRLAARSDVVIENFKVGQLAKYGLDYASIKALKSDIIYCSITGFGQTGPYASQAGYDFIVEGMGGFMSMTGEAEDRPGGGPQKAGVAIADLFAGANAAIAVLAALAHRERSGEGQYLDISLLDAQVAMMAPLASHYLISGEPPPRLGNAHPNIVPYQTFRASDDWLIIAAGNDRQYRAFVESGGQPTLADDPRFLRNADRVRHRQALLPLLEPMVAQRSRRDWIERLNAVGVPCGPINNLAEVFEDPQVLARGMLIEQQHPQLGTIRQPGSALKLDGTPVSYRRPPPLLGEHGDEVLTDWLALTPDELDALRREGVI